MWYFIIKFLVAVVIVTLLVYVLPGIKTSKFYCAIVVGVIISLANLLISPVLTTLELPLIAASIGLAMVLLDAVILFLAGKILKGVSVDGFGWAFVFAVVLSLIIYLLELFLNLNFFVIEA
jgi:putative membrane protein